MKKLPSFRDHIEERPDDYTEVVQRKIQHMIASPRDHEWWSLFLSQMKEIVIFDTPLQNDSWSISSHFGYYGRRFHPIEGVPLYFHTGIDFQAPVRTPIFPVTDGILEYSGYGLHNGNYILISHPDVVTEDGYRLTSSYMHLRSYDVSFTSYQKMLREISLNTYPAVPMYRDTKIGELGSSGMHTSVYPHVHIQLFLIKKIQQPRLCHAKIFNTFTKITKMN